MEVAVYHGGSLAFAVGTPGCAPDGLGWRLELGGDDALHDGDCGECAGVCVWEGGREGGKYGWMKSEE